VKTGYVWLVEVSSLYVWLVRDIPCYVSLDQVKYIFVRLGLDKPG
jgi:hypothetical protein